MKFVVEGFKGIERSEVNLQSGKVSILTGVNSCGKTSTLQSMLLLAQSDKYGINTEGDLGSFGAPKNIINTQFKSKNGITIEMIRSEDKPERIYTGGKRGRFSSENPFGGFSRITPRSGLTGELYGYKINNQRGYEYINSLCITLSAIKNTKSLIINNMDIKYSKGTILRYSSEKSKNLTIKSSSKKDIKNLAKSIFGVNIGILSVFEGECISGYIICRGISEFYYLFTINKVEYLYDDIESIIYKAFEIGVDSGSSRMANILYRDKTDLHRVELLLYDQICDDLMKEQGSSDGEENVNRFRRSSNEMKKLFNIHKEKIIKKYLEKTKNIYDTYCVFPSRQNQEYATYDNNILIEYFIKKQIEKRFSRINWKINLVEELISSLREFTGSIRYMGPLRVEPDFYKINKRNYVSSQNAPLGTRGENVAYYLRNAELDMKKVKCYVPEPDDISKLQEKSLDFGIAVDKWMSYIGLGESISIDDVPNAGYDIKIKPKNSELNLSLGSVGFGISQALPIVVGILEAPQNSIFIVEQPELHLHPDAQGRMIDFLIKARNDIAVVIETHSEPMLTRIRRRIAEDSVLKERIEVIFIDRGEKGSISKNMSISKMGDIDEWPEGFLNGSVDDVGKLLKLRVAHYKEI
jgi:hypothetical protein